MTLPLVESQAHSCENTTAAVLEGGDCGQHPVCFLWQVVGTEV